MSCIRFSTPAQMRQLREVAPSMLTREQASSLHPAPAVTESKLRRLTLLAGHANPKIRESVASSPHAPAGVVAALALDRDEGVRGCLARNPAVSREVLRVLALDESETVRGWVAINPATPPDTLEHLAADTADVVSGLVRWRMQAS